jgi:hypothetical protein
MTQMAALDPSHKKNKHPTFSKNRKLFFKSLLPDEEEEKNHEEKDHVEQLQTDHEENNHVELQRKA